MSVTCGACGESFEAKRKTARYCSDRCRKRGQRSPETVTVPEPPAPTGQGEESGLVGVTRRELQKLGKVDTVMGQQALELARRMVNPAESGAAVASLSREHSRVMALLARGARTVDPVQAAKDEVARKRAQRNAG